MKSIYFTVNNELNYDQRMTRICSSLASQNYNVLLIGKSFRNSAPISPKPFQQYRIHCNFKTGKMAYAEFNIKLFFYLLFRRPDCLCAIDLDTILPVLFISKLKNCLRIYDAHELFTEMKEVVSRPGIKKLWDWVEKTAVPRFPLGYTVSEAIREVFNKNYGVDYLVIRNMPVLNIKTATGNISERVILYQGAVNYGRCLEYLIPAMKLVNSRLIICGDGNFMAQSRKLVDQHQLSGKVSFKGMLLPSELQEVTNASYIGVNLVEPDGLNQMYSLANKFFDYMHAALPQLSMDFIEYARINKAYKVALLIPEPRPELIASAMNLLLENDVLYNELRENCLKAREIYNWHNEEKVLLGFYKKIFN